MTCSRSVIDLPPAVQFSFLRKASIDATTMNGRGSGRVSIGGVLCTATRYRRPLLQPLPQPPTVKLTVIALLNRRQRYLDMNTKIRRGRGGGKEQQRRMSFYLDVAATPGHGNGHWKVRRAFRLVYDASPDLLPGK